MHVLFGVPATARLRITAPGYVTSEQTVHLRDHQQSVDFGLTLSEPRPDSVLSGIYKLRITLATPCGDKDPGPEFRDRTYTATISHLSPIVIEVILTDADMVVSSRKGDRFTGRVTPSGATFTIDDDFYGYTFPQVVERLPNGLYFVVGGGVATQRVTEGFVGTMTGSMRFGTERPGQDRFFNVCWSDDITFALLK